MREGRISSHSPPPWDLMRGAGIKEKKPSPWDTSAGERTQHTGSLAIGAECGNSVQGQVILGSEPTNPAVTVAQAGLAIAIGTRAGYSGQRYQGIAVGRSAGRNDQGYYSLAIGSEAGQTNQGQQAIAIGRQAGCSMAARAPLHHCKHPGGAAEQLDHHQLGRSQKPNLGADRLGPPPGRRGRGESRRHRGISRADGLGRERR